MTPWSERCTGHSSEAAYSEDPIDEADWDRGHQALPDRLRVASAVVPLRADVFALHRAGHHEIRPDQGELDGGQEDRPMSPLDPGWVSAGPLARPPACDPLARPAPDPPSA